MIVRPAELFAVFAAMVEAYSLRKMLPQPLHKVLEIGLVQPVIVRQILIVVSEGNEGIVVVQAGLM